MTKENNEIEWHSLSGQKTEWFDGMVEATFAVGNDHTVYVITDEEVKDIALNYIPLPKREWVGLTDVEIADIEDEELTLINTETFSFAKAIEAKLKEKNT